MYVQARLVVPEPLVLKSGYALELPQFSTQLQSWVRDLTEVLVSDSGIQ